MPKKTTTNILSSAKENNSLKCSIKQVKLMKIFLNSYYFYLMQDPWSLLSKKKNQKSRESERCSCNYPLPQVCMLISKCECEM